MNVEMVVGTQLDPVAGDEVHGLFTAPPLATLLVDHNSHADAAVLGRHQCLRDVRRLKCVGQYLNVMLRASDGL